MNQQTSEVFSNLLAHLKWDETHAIPIANEENQALIHKFDQLQRRLYQRSVELDVEKSKVQQLKEHMKSIKQETDNISSMCELRGNIIDTEAHQFKTVKHEQDRLHQEIRRIHRVREDIRAKTGHLENLAFQKRNEVQKVNSVQGTNKEALTAWVQQLEARHDDLTSLQKYLKEDDTKVKELSLELEHLTTKRHGKKAKLDELHTKVLQNQVALNKFGQEIVTAYTEREQVITQWQNVVARMHQQDSDLRKLNEMVNQARLEEAKGKEAIRECEDFLKAQQQSTLEAQRRADEVVHTIGKTRVELTESEEKRQNFVNELEAFKRMVDRLASDLESTRIKINQVKKEKAKKIETLDQLHLTLETLEEKHAYIVDSKRTAEQLADEADANLTAAEASQEQLTRLLDKLRRDQFKVVQNCEKLSGEAKILQQQLQGAYAFLRMAKSNLADLDSRLMGHQEVMYKQDFKIQHLERRVARLRGEELDDSSDVLRKQVCALEEDLEDKTKATNFLNVELANIRREVHRRKREANDLAEKSAEADKKLQNDDAEVIAATKQKNKLTSVIQNLTVDLNLLRLDVRRLFTNYQKRSDKVFSLEAAREELECAIKLHLEQLALRQKLLTNEARLASEENGKLKMELQSRKAHTDILIKRYEILTSLMAPPEGEEERSQSYYVIKAAQDKEALQRRGDQLDAETKQAEQELIALENTLALMNGCNTMFRHSYTKLPEDADELTLAKELKEELRVLSIKQRYDQVRLSELQETERTKLESKMHLEADLDLYKQQNQKLAAEVDRKSRDISTQNDRYNRAVRRLQKLQVNVATKQIVDPQQYGIVREDIKVRMLKELIDRMIQELLARIRANEQIMEQAQTLLSAYGIRFSTLSERRVSRTLTNSIGSQSGSLRTTSPSVSTVSGRGSPCASHPVSRTSSAKSSETRSVRSDALETQSTISQASSTKSKSVRSVNLGQQAVFPGEAQSKSGSQSSRSIDSESSISRTGRNNRKM